MEATLENSGGSDWKAKVLRSVPVSAPAVNATVLHALLWRTEMWEEFRDDGEAYRVQGGRGRWHGG